MSQQLVLDSLPMATLEILKDAACVHLLVRMQTPKRFGELLKIANGSSKTLSKRLKLLESNGLVSRTLYAEVPPRTVYSLTPKAHELLQLLSGIAAWERSWSGFNPN
jgi:DNA-binding HxlR family transcriptional regulator